MKVTAFSSALLAALLLAGCASPGSMKPNQSTMTDVRARSGTPTDIRFDRNGDELWEYATGPAGYETFLIRFGADGRVKSVTQLLTPERLMQVEPGRMTKAQVRDLLGRPSDESFTMSGPVWSWRFQDGAQIGNLAVSFNPDNTVKERMVLPDPTGGDSKDK
jgi:SmpA / OmlA family